MDPKQGPLPVTQPLDKGWIRSKELYLSHNLWTRDGSEARTSVTQPLDKGWIRSKDVYTSHNLWKRNGSDARTSTRHTTSGQGMDPKQGPLPVTQRSQKTDRHPCLWRNSAQSQHAKLAADPPLGPRCHRQQPN